MTRIQYSGGFLLMTLIFQGAVAQGPDAWDREAAEQEIDRMRRGARGVWGATAAWLKHKPRDQFPAVHAFLQEFDAARKAVDPQKAPHEWKSIDVEALAIRNPEYWAAVYELEPASPMMMMFHASLHGVNGEVAPTLYSQLLTLRSPNRPKGESWLKAMSVANAPSVRLIVMGDKAVEAGVRFHDQQEYDKAAKVFRDVLSVIPSHSLALYELGHTLRKKDRSKAGTDAAQAKFDQARQVDPFRVEAYQGSFSFEEMQRVSILRTQAKPAWDKFMQTSPTQDTVEQLEQLSSQLQAAGLHELGLLVRQLVVAHRENSYNEDDVQFIKASLTALMPEEDSQAVLKGLEDYKPKP